MPGSKKFKKIEEALKKKPGVDNPYALAHWVENRSKKKKAKKK